MDNGISYKNLLLHAPLLIISLIAAGVLGYSHWLTEVLQFSGNSTFGIITASLVAGIFYSSIFTVAPATVALFEIGASGAPIPLMAISAGIGAMLSDISIFEVMKLSFINDIIAHFQRRSRGHFAHLLRIRFFKILFIIVGAITIATPIPDEIGLAMMGIGKAKLSLVSGLTLLLNTAGVAVIGFLAQASS